METRTISKPSWQDQLRKKLEQLHRPDSPPRVAVIGYGNDLCGDDTVGPLIARALKKVSKDHSQFLAIDAGVAPENFTGPLRQFKPDLVLLLDAADMGAAPGQVGWLDWRAAEGYSASTHTLPPSLLGAYLESELGCLVYLIGIQPAGTSFGDDVSPAVRSAAAAITRELIKTFNLS